MEWMLRPATTEASICPSRQGSSMSTSSSTQGLTVGMPYPSACRIAREERAFVRALGGGCSSPVAAYGERKEGMLLLWGLYYDEKSGNYRIGSRKEALEAATGMGAALAEELREAASRQQEPAGRQGE